MPTLSYSLSCPIRDSFRVRQVMGLFDVPPMERASERFEVELPPLDDDWRVGLIVGPSGSGKSTLARRWLGDALYEPRDWPADAAVVDGFGDLPIKTITGLFTAVGFSSPPAWLRPYQVLSTGERFRCDLARSLAQATGVDRAAHHQASGDKNDDAGDGNNRQAPPPLVVFDEFTSVVDRTVAQVGSAAIRKALDAGLVRCRFVAVTCHYDVEPWLAPDWIVDMATRTWSRRRLRRPSVQLEIFRASREAWPVFARHHYLSGSLSGTARCFLATWDDIPVAMCATLPIMGRRGHWRISRVVTLPDYQGLGIGMRFAEAVAELHRAEGHRLNITASHPAVIGHCRRSPLWRLVRVMPVGSPRVAERRVRGRRIREYCGSRGRSVVSFEYQGTAGA